jgi:hypothetical protein
MKRHLYLLAISLFSMLAIASCTKDMSPDPIEEKEKYNAGNVTGSKTKLNALFAEFRSTPQSFTVTAGTNQTITGAEGTVLTFYPHSFKDAQGNIITSGTISIKLIEMYKPGAMIANRATTTNNGKLLISGGQVNIKATKNGQEVFANSYGIAFPQQYPSNQPMALYYGNTDNPDSLTTWTIADTLLNGTTTNGTTNDSFNNYYVNEFDSCTNFNWINCDYFYNVQGPLTNISVVMPDTNFNASNTQVFIVFPSINSVTNVSVYNAGTSTFSLGMNYEIPVGMTIHIVAITNNNGQYYYFEDAWLTSTANMSVTTTMTPQTQAYIFTQLSQL